MRKTTKQLFLQGICYNLMALNPKDNRHYFIDSGHIAEKIIFIQAIVPPERASSRNFAYGRG